jgi:hypothetical protein
VRLTNAHGTVPLVIGEAHLALRGSGAAIRPGTRQAARVRRIPPGHHRPRRGDGVDVLRHERVGAIVALGDSLTDGDSSGDAPVTGISVSVRAEGTSAAGRLSFQVDDVGWTGVRDG